MVLNASTFDNCTLVANNAFLGSGVLIGIGASATFSNSILALNGSLSSAIKSNAGSLFSFTCGDLFGNAGGDISGSHSVADVDSFTIFEDPVFCDPGMGDYTISLFSPCDETNSPCGQLIGAFNDACSITNTCCVVPGDFDHDGTFNITDLTAFIAWLFSGGLGPVCCDEADANGDGTANISDVTYMIARVFSGGPAPLCPTPGNITCSN